jgi:hypothetical protein
VAVVTIFFDAAGLTILWFNDLKYLTAYNIGAKGHMLSLIYFFFISAFGTSCERIPI